MKQLPAPLIDRHDDFLEPVAIVSEDDWDQLIHYVKKLERVRDASNKLCCRNQFCISPDNLCGLCQALADLGDE